MAAKKIKADQIGVKVTPDTTGFAEELRTFIQRVQTTAEIVLKVKLDDRGLDAQVQAAARAAQEAAGDTRNTTAQHATDQAARDREATVNVDADTAHAEAQLDALTRRRRTAKVDVDVKAAAAKMGSFFASLGKVAAVGTGILAISAGAVVAAANVVTLAASLSAVVGVAGLLPAIAGSLAAIAATAVTAFSGVGTALSEVNKANKPQSGPDPRLEAMRIQDAQGAIADAEANAADAAEESARRISDAKQALADAVAAAESAHLEAVKAAEAAEKRLVRANRDAQDAQETLNKAREKALTNLRDINSELGRASLSEREAAVAYRDAQDAYNQALTDPSKSGNAVAALQLQMDKTAQALADAQSKVQDLSADKAKAVREEKTGTEEVIRAQRNLTDAQDAAAEAARARQDAQANIVRTQVEGQRNVADAARNVADAQKASAKSQEDSAKSVERAQRSLEQIMIQQADSAKAAGKASREAMENLTPAAQGVVTTLLAVKDRLGEVRKIAQENFFSGMSAPLTTLVDTILPGLKTGVGDIAKQLGGGVQEWLGSLTSALGGGVLETILGNVAKTVGELNRGIAPFVTSFTTLTTVGSSFLPQLAGGFSDLLSKFDAFIQRAAADGSLANWIQGGLDAVKDIASVAGSVFKIFEGINKAASASGGGTTLSSFADGLKTVADMVNAEPFQTTLTTVFDTARVILGSIVGILSDPAMQAGISALVDGLFAGFSALAPALPAISTILGAILTLAGELAAQVGPILAELFITLAPLVSDLVTALIPLVQSLGPALISIMKFAAPLAGFMIGALVGLMPVLTDFLNFLTSVFNGDILRDFGKVFGETARRLGEGFDGMMKDLSRFGEGIGRFFTQDLPKMIGDAFGGLGKFFGSAGESLMKWFADGIKNAAGGVGRAVSGVIDWVKGFFPHSPALRGPLSGSGWTSLRTSGATIGDQFALGLSDGTTAVGNASDSLMRAVAMPKASTWTMGNRDAGTAAGLGTAQTVQNITVKEAFSARATATEVARLLSPGV